MSTGTLTITQSTVSNNEAIAGAAYRDRGYRKFGE